MSKFHVVRVDGKETLFYPNETHPNSGYKTPSVYSAQQAQDMASYLTRNEGAKYQPRPIQTNEDWREREIASFASGHYTKVPWHNEEWVTRAHECVDHFTHVANKQPMNVAFTADNAKGQANVKTVTKPSTYLSRYYGRILSEATIRSWVANYRKIHDKESIVKFAYSPDEIENTYRKGPHSCMANPSYRSGIHPVRVYSGPDLAIAYIERSSKIVARTVVWPEKKLYSRIYGDHALMMAILEEDGFNQGSMNGARLTKIKNGNRIVCPYIDHEKHVKIGIKYIRIAQKGDGLRIRFAGNQNGYCGTGFNCALCRTENDMEKVPQVIVDGVRWCETHIKPKLEAGEIFQCSYNGHYYSIQHAIALHDGTMLHRMYFYENGYTCRACGLNIQKRAAAIHTSLRQVPMRGYYAWTGICRTCPTQLEMQLASETDSDRLASRIASELGR